MFKTGHLVSFTEPASYYLVYICSRYVCIRIKICFYHWQPEYSRCHDPLWIHRVNTCTILSKNPPAITAPWNYRDLWVDLAEYRTYFHVTMCRARWSKQYRSLSWITYGTCLKSKLSLHFLMIIEIVLSILQSQVDWACFRASSWSDGRKFKIGFIGFFSWH